MNVCREISGGLIQEDIECEGREAGRVLHGPDHQGAIPADHVLYHLALREKDFVANEQTNRTPLFYAGCSSRTVQ